MTELYVGLERFLTQGSKIFSGRDRGKEVRRALKLDEVDASKSTVVVHVPEDAFSVNSSFFLGLFTASIERLGESGFREKYRFTGKPIDRVVDEAIRVTTATSSSPFTFTG
jgi:hypothetical protein